MTTAKQEVLLLPSLMRSRPRAAARRRRRCLGCLLLLLLLALVVLAEDLLEVCEGGEEERGVGPELGAPGDGGGGDEVEAGQQLFREVEPGEERAPEERLDEGGRHRGPDHVRELADARHHERQRPDEVDCHRRREEREGVYPLLHAELAHVLPELRVHAPRQPHAVVSSAATRRWCAARPRRRSRCCCGARRRGGPWYDNKLQRRKRRGRRI
mmetsp:Transcript_2180/g.6468  ORF Transcript_2180/g.6468 Transcript_2180/m.6468 type:complete len:213 (+) Transcript_2180:65-703(+)